MSFSAHTRKETIKSFKNTKLDVLIIGGGITGAGLALHGAARGMKIGLIEMKDFASGTSSRSTKLVHGGLRYLKQFDVKVVADVAQEREVIGKNAPHIVKPTYMLMPIYDEPGASFDDFSSEVVLHLYDYLAKVDEDWKHYFVSKDEVEKIEPTIKKKGLIKGGMYLDYMNDDSRLTIEVLKKADELGAKLTNYVKAIDFLYHQNQIVGVKAEDQLTGEQFEIKSSVVVNATGPWSDYIRNEINNEDEKKMYPTKGVHFVVDYKKLPVKQTIYTDTGLEDNRMIFIIPRGSKTYFGTTDTPIEEAQDSPKVTQKDLDYLLQAVNYRFPEVNLTIEDIHASWAGFRPLIQDEDSSDPSGISRGHEVLISKGDLVTIAGGKLTDYRRMANDTFKAIDKKLMDKGLSFHQVDTSEIPLSGGDVPKGKTFEEYVDEQTKEGQKAGLSQEDADYLVNFYGTNVEKIFKLVDRAKESELSIRFALQVLYALEYEMMITPTDYFARRTETLLFDTEKTFELKDVVINLLEKHFRWSDEEKEKWKRELEEKIRETTLTELKSKY